MTILPRRRFALALPAALILLVCAGGTYAYFYVNSKAMCGCVAQRNDIVFMETTVDISAGDVLTRDMIAWDSAPERFLPPNYISESDAELALGSIVQVDMRAGEMFLKSNLVASMVPPRTGPQASADGHDTSCAEPEEGMRSVYIAVGHSTAHIRAGDVVDLIRVTSEVVPGYGPEREEVYVRPLLENVEVACARSGSVEVLLTLEDASFVASARLEGTPFLAFERVAPSDEDMYDREDPGASSDLVLRERVPFIRRSQRCAQLFSVPTQDYITLGCDSPPDITRSADAVLYPLPVERARERFVPGQRVDVLHGALVPPYDKKAKDQTPVPAGIMFAQGALVHSVTEGEVVLYLLGLDALDFASRREMGTWEVLGRNADDLEVDSDYRPRLPHHVARRAAARR